MQKNSETKQFSLDIIWVGVSQAFSSALSIISLLVITKSFTTETYGIWTQVGVTVNLMVVVISLQLGTAVVRFLAGEDNVEKRRRSLGAMLSVILVFGCLLLIISNLLASQLSFFLFNGPGYTIFVRLSFLSGFATTLFSFFISYLRARRRIQRLSIVAVAYSIVQIVIIVVLAKFGLSLEWILASLVCVQAVLALGVFYLIVLEDGFPLPNLIGIRKFLAFSLPQIPSGFLIWIISSSDRYFITHFLALSETGIYSSSLLLGGTIELLCSPIAFVLLPAVSKAWAQNRLQDVKTYFEYSNKLFLTIAIPGAIGLTMLSQNILKILTTSGYLAGRELVLLVSIGGILSGIFQINNYIIYLIQQTKWIPILIVVASASSIGINLIMIPRIGIIGAAISNCVSYFLLAFIVTIFARMTIKYTIDLKYLSKVILSTMALSVFLYILKIETIWSLVLAIVAGIVVFSIVFILLRPFSNQDKRIIKQMIGR